MCNAHSTPTTYFGYLRYTGVAALLCVVAVKTFRLLVSPVLMRLLSALCRTRVAFFGCFLRFLTWGKRRFSNRSTPDNARFVRRAPVGYFRIFTALHRSCSQLHVALLAARHITISGLLRLLRLGVEHELYELLDLAGRSFECRHEILCLLLQLFVFPFPYAYIAFERFHFALSASHRSVARSCHSSQGGVVQR